MTRRNWVKSILRLVTVSLIVLYSAFPFYYAIVSSFRSGTDIYKPAYFPTTFSFQNYVSIFKNQPFAQNIVNSLIVASAVVIVSMVLAVPAAYALGRVKFRGRRLILLTVLGTSMFPQIAVLSGMYQLIQSLGLYNSLGALIVSNLMLTVPFTAWMLTIFMRELPKEIEEAAIIDGAGPVKIILRVFLPLLWPAMASTGILAFIAAWNEFLFGLTFVVSNENRTVPVAIALITGTNQRELPWGNIMAASVTVTLPIIILVFIFQRRIVSGLTAGAIKG
ncbi:carbohydrate ABC transporter permease [Phyllobacterium chamaecytisi]|uniref:carbohydrate ABC transporter permease n=1 Tax=Phyllobacterium chamaecytisi TaxID=2876082 RepID=UPI001CCADA2F|nr:carbohydrate ABC transporter permease [Phyllobacterium sp. KW56]MBZ9603141.1 carbohydrate ABC transporter permease [Phyllobacterium sp. KW56]